MESLGGENELELSRECCRGDGVCGAWGGQKRAGRRAGAKAQRAP